MTKPWTNADGLQVEFGDFWSDPKNFVNRARAVNTLGAVKQIHVDVDLTRIADGTITYTADLNNDGTADGFSDKDVRLPAYASVLRVTYVAKTTAVGGTSITVGTFTKTGTAIDADGLVTATEGVTANMAIGERFFGNGAYVAATAGTASIGSVPGFIGITGAGTFTAGTGVLVIEYMEPLPDVAA